MRSILCAVVLLVVASARLSGQALVELPSSYCSFAGETEANPLKLSEPDERLKQAVAMILGHSGVKVAFTLRSGNVDNAIALNVAGSPYLVYNADVMSRLDSITGTRVAAISVLAHEIGHHLYHHTLKPGGSRMNEELQADYYSGFIMYDMGVPPDQAVAAVAAMTNEFPPATHPPRSLREARIKAGWSDAYQLEHHLPNYLTVASTVPSPQATFTGPDTAALSEPAISKYVSRPVFYGDQSPYFLTAQSDIVGINGLGQPALVARQKPSTQAGYAWNLSTSTGVFGVDTQGKIWSLGDVRTQVGYITELSPAMVRAPK